MTEDERHGEFVRFMKSVGVICGALIAAGTVVQYVGSWWMATATKDLVTSVERLQVAVAAGERRDSLIVEQIGRLGEAMQYSLGSVKRETALDKVILAPRAVRN